MSAAVCSRLSFPETIPGSPEFILMKPVVPSRLAWLLPLLIVAMPLTSWAQFTALPTIQVTGSGSVATETDYVPNVVFCENGLASFEALKAQAVAARTFAYYKMDRQGFINDGTGDQVYSCNGSPSSIHFEAAAATEGEILYVRDTIGPTVGDVLIASFYVAGAIPTGPFDAGNPSAIPNPGDSDPTGTQQWVTYPYEANVWAGNNLGTPLGFQGSPTNPNWPNRGAKSQNGADFLSDNSVSYVDILKYYYGADIQLRTAETAGTGVTFGEKVLTNFDDYGQRFGGNVFDGHEGYFHRAPDFSGSTTANVAGSTATRSSAEQQSGSDSQRIDIVYDESSGQDFLLRHVAGAVFSDFAGSNNAAARESNLQLESIGSVGFWLKTDDPGLQVSLAMDDPTTGDRGVLREVIADNQWHRYEWFLEDNTDWEAWVGGNGQIDGDRVTIDSIQFIGATDAEVYLDTVFWDPSAIPLPDGDFNDDGRYDCQDVDSLVQLIASNVQNPSFDLNGDGSLDQQDLSIWLAEAGAAELPSGGAFPAADANLDGVVDGQDFISWNNHKFTDTAEFCAGDFNASGTVDGQDFIIWNNLKFQSADAPLSIPEPGMMWPIILAGGLALRRR